MLLSLKYKHFLSYSSNIKSVINENLIKKTQEIFFFFIEMYIHHWKNKNWLVCLLDIQVLMKQKKEEIFQRHRHYCFLLKKAGESSQNTKKKTSIKNFNVYNKI